MKKKARITKGRQLNTYADMWHCSRVLLYKGQEEEKGSYWQFMASLIFTAFTLEAYLNHLGAKLFKCWSDVESLSPLNKLSLLYETLDLELDYSIRPYQTVKELFKFRNKIAHGETVNLGLDEKIRYIDDKFEAYLQTPLSTEWMDFCTEQKALRAREDVERIIYELHEKADIKDDPVFSFGMMSAKASVITDDSDV